MFAFEYAFCHEYMLVPSPQVIAEIEGSSNNFVPQIELDFEEGGEELNKVFADCLVKYIDVLGRKGCCRTSMEFCKLLLGLTPHLDSQGALLRIDYYAIRAREYIPLLDFLENFGDQVYNQTETDRINCIKLMPNLMMAGALACRSIDLGEECKNHNESLD